MALIEDGKGSGKKMSVSSTQRGNVSAKTSPRMYYSSRDDGLAYNAVYECTAVTTGDYSAYLKNTSSTRNLFISEIEFHSLLATKWKIWSVSGTAAAGTAIIPTELNLSKGITAEATARQADSSTLTGLTTIAQVGSHRNEATGDSGMNFQGSLILGPGDAIALECDVGVSGLVSHDIFFWFENIGAS